MMDNSKVDISVILPTYNRPQALCNVLKQLLSQDVKPLEIIVIDQTPEHRRESKDFLRELIDRQQIIYLYQALPNVSAARNQGIRIAKGEVLLFLDDDVVIPSDLLNKHFNNYKIINIASVCGQVLEVGQTPTDRFPPQYQRRHTGWIHFPLNFLKRRETINLNSGNLSIRKDILVEAGGFDENFFQAHFDDTDLAIRVQKVSKKMGLKMIYDPKATLIHFKETRGNRPQGLNEYVVADRYAWRTWLYFFLLDFGIYGFWEISLRLRRCVFRKKNILRPDWLWVAFLEFVIGLKKALALIRQGRKLPFLNKDEDSTD